jgi:hypothetical protein
MVPSGLDGERQLLRTGHRQPAAIPKFGVQPAGARAAVIAFAEGPQLRVSLASLGTFQVIAKPPAVAVPLAA